MTETEINKSIAEALRWKWKPKGDKWGPLVHPWIAPDGTRSPSAPNYYRDLNACKEMIAALKTKQQQDEFAEHLTGFWDEECCDLAETAEWLFAAVQFTAPQLCEAFLKTIGRWKE